MTVLGNIVLLAGLCTAAAGAFLYLQYARGRAVRIAIPRQLFKIHAVLVGFASLILLAQIFKHDFSNGYVYSYSDRGLPFHYLLSTFYAGQQGSFLFWGLCAVIIALFVRHYAAKREAEPQVMAVLLGIQTALFCVMAVKSPFQSIWSMFPDAPPGALPPDGRGLNPLLQNFWMVIHPPVLFVGFAAMAVPFAYAIAGLWKKEADLLVQQGLPWVLFAVASLGAGLMLGGYWAYGVLGWGGYWGWDPVENSSLVPWLTGMALVHTLLAQLRTGRYARTNHALALLSFALVIFSTFLTRSGILGDASVHSFTDPGTIVYGVLLALLGGTSLLGIAMLALRWGEFRPQGASAPLLTREVALGAGTFALILIAAVVLFGTSLPIFSKIRVEPTFYDSATLPIAIAMGLLIGLSLYAQWEEQEWKPLLRRMWKSAAAAVLATAGLVLTGVRDPLLALLGFASAFTMFVNIDIAVTVAKGNWRFLGGKLAHIGVAVFLFGVIGSGKYSTHLTTGLPMNIPKDVLGYSMTYAGSRQLPDGKFAFDVRVESPGTSALLSPVMFQTREQGIMRNPDILSLAAKDIYISPVKLEGGEPQTVGEPVVVTIAKGETKNVGPARITFRRFEMAAHDRQPGGEGMPIGAQLLIQTAADSEWIVPVSLFTARGAAESQPLASRLLGATVRLVDLSVGMGGGETSSVTLSVERIDDRLSVPETLIVEASVKPFILLVWLGTLIMMAGFALSIVHRAKGT